MSTLSRRGILADAYAAPGGGGPLAFDTFDRANGPIGTSTSGHVWTIGSGSWTIVGNQLDPPPGTGTYPQVNIDVGVADVAVEATILPDALGNTDIGVAARVTDDSNYAMLNVSRSGGVYVCRIFERTGGGFNGRSVLIDPVPGIVDILDPMVVKLVVTGTSAEGFVNGASVVTGTLVDHLTQTRHGLVAGDGNDARYDDWSVT